MTEARNFKRERFAVGALIVSTAVLCVVGALSQFLEFSAEVEGVANFVLVAAFAALCGFSLWVANVAAACAQILADHRKAKPWAFAIALFTAGLTGLVSVIGVDLAWMTLTGQQQAYPDSRYIVAAGFALGFVKVAMGFVIEACEKVANAEERSHDALVETLRAQVRTLEAEVRKLASQAEKPFVANDVEATPQAPRRASPSQSRGVARAFRDVPLKTDNRPQREVREGAERAPPLTEDAIRETIAEMTASGDVINFSTVAKRRGVPYSRVERSPGRHLIEALRVA